MEASYSKIHVPLLSIVVYIIITVSNTEAANGIVQNQLATANNEFAFELYRKISASSPGQNVLLSPVSIAIGLGMLYEGAAGQTKAQMAKAMRLTDYDSESVKEDFRALIDGLGRPTNNYTLYAANRLYGNIGFPFRDDFLRVTGEYFRAGLEALDFGQDPSGSRATINRWVSTMTSNKIRDLLSDGSVDSGTVLVLVNAIYFKGLWLNQFDKSRTEQREFHLTRNQIATATMMTFDYADLYYTNSTELACQVLELPYTGSEVSMVLFLPHDIEGLASVESRLKSDALTSVFNSMYYSRVAVNLPTFVLNQGVSLRQFLEAVGIVDVFDISKADLSGIDGTQNLVLSTAVHQAFVSVDEEGTEAAGATGFGVQVKSVKVTLSIHFNRPFLFAIVERSTGTVLFLGRVSVPPPEGAEREPGAVAEGVRSAVASFHEAYTRFRLFVCLLLIAQLFNAIKVL